MVLVGAEGVVENGGIINKLGTYTIALAAAASRTPMYVAAESYKFARLYPLNQRDYPLERKPLDFGPLMPRGCKIENPSRDYTPPSELPLSGDSEIQYEIPQFNPKINPWVFPTENVESGLPGLYIAYLALDAPESESTQG
jgi:hypothetical protein